MSSESILLPAMRVFSGPRWAQFDINGGCFWADLAELGEAVDLPPSEVWQKHYDLGNPGVEHKGREVLVGVQGDLHLFVNVMKDGRYDCRRTWTREMNNDVPFMPFLESGLEVWIRYRWAIAVLAAGKRLPEGLAL